MTPDQLPPVGAGDVFGDLIRSGSFMAVRLTEIFRQGKDSRIILGAHMINNGKNAAHRQQGQRFLLHAALVRTRCAEAHYGTMLHKASKGIRL